MCPLPLEPRRNQRRRVRLQSRHQHAHHAYTRINMGKVNCQNTKISFGES